ncbi:hypothetical protein RSOLAG1IB_09061 [Rhizoctonia solani AG-1 IB]|uniref:Uncharacterized protein n=1 Tax=Thanatephorus cucumeris (strain AG1-IB / isolate 7/3/14) TaxID=1108050 RepID=A0A0B7FQ95_THACB|nr:hypothetical protein RSOLAG1IB_09061 [Rhizoctonia solani AG-1 IB]
MGCKSSKSFKEKDTSLDTDGKPPTVVNASEGHPRLSKDETPSRASASKPAAFRTKRSGGGQSDTNAHLIPGTNPVMSPVYFPTPIIDPGQSDDGRCHNGGGHSGGGYSGRGYSGGYDSGGGGYSGGCDSGGGFSSSSF